ncbi:hypothetical protein [Epilithonimonas sp.]|uniref:hypothetical protein n=1 Tax=Epilithonimonas sp. TaxID=2894511 RepID=UPI00289C6DD1|nr:hypothetical protein [Epilithonimonas sp.]
MKRNTMILAIGPILVLMLGKYLKFQGICLLISILLASMKAQFQDHPIPYWLICQGDFGWLQAIVSNA